jgi:hypothetical protein
VFWIDFWNISSKSCVALIAWKTIIVNISWAFE